MSENLAPDGLTAGVNLRDALGLNEFQVTNLPDDQLRHLMSLVLGAQQNDRKENQILYYQPVSDIARDVWRCDTRYQIVGGGNGACLPLDAPVLMADGSWRTLREVQPGDRVIAADLVSGKAVPANVVRTYRSGEKPIWRVTCSDGTWFEATDEHEIPILRGSGRKTSKGNVMQPRKARLGTWRGSVETRLPAKRISVIVLKHKQTFRMCDPIDYSRRICRKVEFSGYRSCGDLEVDHPAHCYVTRGNVIVSNSKSETMLAKLVALSTGMFPINMKEADRAALRSQFRGPVNVRVVVESLTTTLAPIILPKLQWWQWSGADSPGGFRGHWGWLPRRALKQGSWVASWNEKTRLLRHLCLNPDNPDEVLGESMWQFMAHNQDPTDFASGDFHFVLHDELTKHAIWRENEARSMRVGGKMLMAFTWPDDASIPVDWVFDRLYEPALPGPGKNPNVSWFEMWTQDNKNLDQSSVQIQAGQWDETVKQARLFGRPIRFSNRVHPEFTNTDTWWCKADKKKLFSPDACGHGAKDVVKYNHVEAFEVHPTLPVVCLLDPHPRKPHMLLWVQIDTWDDWWVVAERQVLGEPDDVRRVADEVEREFHLNVVLRVGDRNMLSSPSGKHRDVTWQDEFADAGLRFELSDVSDVGRGRINDMLKLNPDREQPRLHFHPRCGLAIRQMLRYVWDEYRQQEGRDLKQIPKDKDDDYPTLLKYLANADPKFEYLMHGAPVIRTRKR